jgi:hypothetical protein
VLSGYTSTLTTIRFLMAQTILSTLRLKLVHTSLWHLSTFRTLVDSMRFVKLCRSVQKGRPLSASDAEAGHIRRLSTAKRVPGLGYWAGYIGAEFVG